jgi:ribonuclease R
VVESSAPDAGGQRLLAQDREGSTWEVECLGEPVAVGDRILFQPLERRKTAGARRAQLVRVVERQRSRWVVRVVDARGGKGLSLIPFGGAEMPEMRLLERDAKGAVVGDRVLVAPLVSGRGAEAGRKGRGRSRGARGGGQGRDALAVKVVEVLGAAGDPAADHSALVWKFQLSTEFSRRARLEAEAIQEALTPLERNRRVDLRGLPFVTIDPASARDHDDAVFAEEASPPSDLRAVGREPRLRPGSRTRRLWVAIADVAHFVESGGFLDAEARRRGNSFYFPDRSIPMLPERLSSDLCSLRPGVDRRALVVELRLGVDGEVQDALFHEAMIRSRARLSYEEASEWLDADAQGAGDTASEWAASLRCLDRVARDLGRLRRSEGALELTLPEVEILVDTKGHPRDARLRSRNRAHTLIEEAMLAANRAVARTLERAGRPALHRVHAPPSPVRLAALAGLLERLGVEAPEDLETPGRLATVLEAVSGQPSEERVQTAALRAMSRARYAANSEGHYALRFDHYLHFTSPIRRYADLEVHRALRAMLRGEPLDEESRTSGLDHSERLGLWLSGRERVAAEAERESEALASCALMSRDDHRTWQARVTGATEFGAFVRLERPAVSGLVPIRSLPGRWRFEPEEEVLVEGGGRRRLELGQAVEVRLLDVDPDRGRLAFVWVGQSSKSERDSERRSHSA